jgi:hypothetical protein
MLLRYKFVFKFKKNNTKTKFGHKYITELQFIAKTFGNYFRFLFNSSSPLNNLSFPELIFSTFKKSLPLMMMMILSSLQFDSLGRRSKSAFM